MATQKPVAAISGKRKQSDLLQNHPRTRRRKMFAKINKDEDNDEEEEGNGNDARDAVLHDNGDDGSGNGNDEDSWVDVRKQRIIIIIPALPKPPPKKRIRNRKTLRLSSPDSRIQAQKGTKEETLSHTNAVNSRFQVGNSGGNGRPVTPINAVNHRMQTQKSRTEDLRSGAKPNLKIREQRNVNQEALNVANTNVHGQGRINQGAIDCMNLNLRSRDRKNGIQDPLTLTYRNSGCRGLKSGNKETSNLANPINLRIHHRQTEPFCITNPNLDCRYQKGKNNIASNATFSHDEEVPDGGVEPSVHVKGKERKKGFADINCINVLGSYKRKRKCGAGRFSKENTKKRQSDRAMLSDQPISSMDILLASALDADHGDSVAWQEDEEENEEWHHKKSSVQGAEEEISLDTADSGIQQKDISHLQASSVGVSKARAETGKVSLSLGAKIGSIFDEHVITSQDACVNSVETPLRWIQIPPILTANQAFRVSMLKKHLDKAGGFGKWLCLVGLDQFTEAFSKRMWSEVELLQLKMDDLKHMGKCAVGPRRKLIWAINHLSQQLI